MENNMNTNYSVSFNLLDDIRFCAENALELAKLSREEYHGKINWNEIEVENNGVEFFVNANGCSGYRIELTGCGEKCSNLHDFIEQYVFAELKVPVEVLSEY